MGLNFPQATFFISGKTELYYCVIPFGLIAHSILQSKFNSTTLKNQMQLTLKLSQFKITSKRKTKKRHKIQQKYA
uniref:Uncharacterized protein n=1 Tax=Rhizophora mucronata TaxID=61149 RepID=A0A2P2NM06_RHIMU